MNTNQAAAVIVLGTLLSPLALHAQSAGTECNLVIAMNEYRTEAGTVLKDEFGKPVAPGGIAFENEWNKKNASGKTTSANYEFVSKTTKYRISNKEILERFVAKGLISTITGWSIKAVFPAFSPEEGGSPPAIYLVNTSAPKPIYIGEYFDFDGIANTRAVKYATTETFKYDSAGEEAGSTLKVTGGISEKETVSVKFSLGDEFDIKFRGIWNSSASVKTINGENYFLPGNGSLTNIAGRLTTDDSDDDDDHDDDDDASVIDGSWSISGAKVLPDIEALYPEAVSRDHD